MAIVSDKVSIELCEALGLNPSNVKSICVTLEAGEVATIDIGEYLRTEQGRELGVVLKRYELVPKEK